VRSGVKVSLVIGVAELRSGGIRRPRIFVKKKRRLRIISPPAT
jgi:hypothetical protein